MITLYCDFGVYMAAPQQGATTNSTKERTTKAEVWERDLVLLVAMQSTAPMGVCSGTRMHSPHRDIVLTPLSRHVFPVRTSHVHSHVPTSDVLPMHVCRCSTSCAAWPGPSPPRPGCWRCRSSSVASATRSATCSRTSSPSSSGWRRTSRSRWDSLTLPEGLPGSVTRSLLLSRCDPIFSS